MMSRQTVVFTLFAAGILAAGGCTGLPEWRTIELKDSAGVPLSAVPSVEIDNAWGTVTVEVDPRVTRPEVLGKIYPSGGLTKPIRERMAENTEVTAEVLQTEGRPIVRVHGRPPEGQEAAAAVEISVRLAACYGVTVKNSGGAVRLSGVGGPITVENGVGGNPGGMVIVRTGQTMTDDVRLLTTNGDIYYQIPPASTGRLDLLSLDGEAALRAQGGRLTDVKPTHTWYQGVLNGGTNPVLLRSGKGLVRVTVLDNAGEHVPAE